MIENVTASLEILIEKLLDMKVFVHEFLNLDHKTVFLVLVEGKPATEKIYAFGGQPMYYINAYDAWGYLVVVETDFHAEKAREEIAMISGVKQVVDGDPADVNETDFVDINDAQLVYDLYNGKYQDFSVISMTKFLRADVNGDKTVSVKDAACVVAEIE